MMRDSPICIHLAGALASGRFDRVNRKYLHSGSTADVGPVKDEWLKTQFELKKEMVIT